jgi:predicted O-methyltransferase YrrM
MIDEKIQDYADRFTSDHNALLEEILQKTYAERSDKSMLSGSYQGRLLSALSRTIAPRRALEIGTYMGFSALCLAEGLTADGRLYSLDIEPETFRLATGFWARSPLGAKIEGRLGNALEIIPTIDERLDMVFIDADKPNYSNYFDLVFPKLRIGGVILADNVLWSGEVLKAERGDDVDDNTRALHDFNKKISADRRVSQILLTVRDGLLMIIKERD